MEVNKIQYIGFFKRILIYLVEMLGLLVPMIFLYQMTTRLAIEYQSILIIYFKWILVFGVNLFLLVLFGGGIGKLIFGVRVVNSKGNYPTLLQALIRYSPIMVSGMISATNEVRSYEFGFDLSGYIYNVLSICIIIFIIFDVVSILLNKEKRAVHDFMADTYVISRKSKDKFKQQTLEG